ncbi:MAG TPA: hypothetical protein VGL81_35655 [Polyangiaceae bacterium]|jgi:hypothetical protein
MGRLLGYVDIKVASRVYKLPVEAAPLEDGAGSRAKPGFFSEGTDALGILVDSNAPDGEQQATIVRASAEAERFISRKFLN